MDRKLGVSTWDGWPACRALGAGLVVGMVWACQPPDKPTGVGGGGSGACVTSDACAAGQVCRNGWCQEAEPGRDGGGSMRFDAGTWPPVKDGGRDAAQPPLDASLVPDDAGFVADAGFVDGAGFADGGGAADAATADGNSADAGPPPVEDAGMADASPRCSGDAGAGWCDVMGEVCHQGTCTPLAQVPCGTRGGMACVLVREVCVGGACVPGCDVDHPSGACATGLCFQGTCVSPRPPRSGDVIISEVMVDPPQAPGESEAGEYLELHVLADGPLQLQGCVLSSSSGTESFTVVDPWVVFPGAWLGVGRTGSAEALGFTPALDLQGRLTLANTGEDDVTLSCGGFLVATVRWGGPGLLGLAGEGVALELSPGHLSAAASTDPARWCRATAPLVTSWGPAWGTPGMPNTCRLPCAEEEPHGLCDGVDLCVDGRCRTPCQEGGDYCVAPRTCLLSTCRLPCEEGGDLCTIPGALCHGSRCLPPELVPCHLGGTQCDEGSTCVDGACLPDCAPGTPDGYCAAPTVCGDDGACRLPCQDGGDYCPSPRACDITTGQCQVPCGVDQGLWCADPARRCHQAACRPLDEVPCGDRGGTWCPWATQLCLAETCVDLCDADHPTGYCAEPTVCDGATCRTPCALGGDWCAGPGDVCAGGACRTPCHLGGAWCPHQDQVCAGNACRDPCSATVPDGYCAPPEVCDGVRCRTPCQDGGDWCQDPGDVCAAGACRTPCDGGGDYCALVTQVCVAGGCTDRCAPEAPAGHCGTAGERCHAGGCTGPCAVGVDGWCAQPDPPGAPVTCDDVTGACVAAGPPVAGEAWISEVLVDAPTVGETSEVGEYVEVFNRSRRVLNLKGCHLVSHTGASGTEASAGFPDDIPVHPLGVAVLRRSTTLPFTFDFPAATYGTVTFSNSAADYVLLRCGGLDVDAVGWRGHAAYPNLPSVPADTAWERGMAGLRAGTPTATATWCQGVTVRTTVGATGTGTFRGSPGAANACP